MLMFLVELLVAVGLTMLIGQVNGWFVSSFVTEDEVRRVALWVAPLTEETLKYAASLAGFGWLYGVVFVVSEVVEYAGHYCQQRSFATLLGCSVMNVNDFAWLRLRAAIMHFVTVALIWRFGVYGMVAGMVIHHVYNRIGLAAAADGEE